MTPTELQVARVLPMPRRIVVRLHKRNERTASGLFLPGGEAVVPTIGTVVEAAPEERDDDGEIVPPMLVEGDTVVFGKFNGTEVRVGNDTLVVVPVAEVACRLVLAQPDTPSER